MKKGIFTGIIVLLLAGVFLGYSISSQSGEFKTKTFEEKRAQILYEINSTINEAQISGTYNCCMNPPCSMCFLGNWISKDGTCNCDYFERVGQLDKVCPECLKSSKDLNSSEGVCSV
jgi:hypothetical protein